MERGRCEVNGHEVVSDAGVVFLGNIETDNMDEYKNMLTELPSLFQESALLDRMHGFIKGWDIPPMQPGLKISGWALNTEYFCTVLHLLREDMSYRAIGLKASWGILKLLCTVIFFPVILIGMVVGGLMYIAFPLLIIGGIIGLVTSHS